MNDTIQCHNQNLFEFKNLTQNIIDTIAYNWDFGNSVTSKAFDTSLHFISSGLYRVRLIASSGLWCSDTAFKELIVKPEANTDFAINDSFQCLQTNVFRFNNLSTIETDTFNAFWDFGDSVYSINFSDDHIFLDTGIFSVTLHTTSDYGCKDSLLKRIKVYTDPSVISAIGEDHCGSGKVTLTAKSLNGIINWYSSDIGGNLLFI